MKKGYVCNCSKCKRKREMMQTKENCKIKTCEQQPICVPIQKICCEPKKKCVKTCANNVACNCNNNCKNKCCINPLFWIFALFLI